MMQQGAPPLVTIVCIFLDEERFLREAINSVIAQDLSDWELVLVDDGSSDCSAAIAREYAARDARIRLVQHERNANLGMSASRNAGVAAGTGRYVTFIDGDDRWPANKLSRQVAIMQAHPEIGATAGAFRIWNSWRSGRDSIEASGRQRDCVTPPPEALLNIYPLGRAGAAAVSAMVTRALFDAIGGFEESFRGFYEDQVFFVKVYAHAPVWFSSDVWQDYRQHEDSCCARVAAEGRYLDERARLLDWINSYIGQLDTAWRDRALSAVRRQQRALRRARLVRPAKARLSALKRRVTSG